MTAHEALHTTVLLKLADFPVNSSQNLTVEAILDWWRGDDTYEGTHMWIVKHSDPVPLPDNTPPPPPEPLG